MRGEHVMSWRTVVIKSHAKISYKNEYMIVRGDDVKMVHLSEIHTVIIDSTQVSMTSFLLCELLKRKVKIILCDEKRNPCGELMPYYGTHNSYKKINIQLKWEENYAKLVLTEIIRQKIKNQAKMLEKNGIETYKKLIQYAENVEFFDATNREGHAAKVYFNSLFGKGFSRDDINNINAALDYGYSILLSCFNKEIVSNGFLTQIGIKHINEYNPFNLTCDMMEPFRILIDEIVFHNLEKAFDLDYKLILVNVLNQKVNYRGKEYFLTNAVKIYLKKIFDAIENQNFLDDMLYQFQ